MDFTPWNWASSFRLHEAACLIAGVVPVSKRHPTSEELPPQARHPLLKLVGAYYEWFLQTKNPGRPKSIVLDGFLNEDGSLPPFPTIAAVTGEIVSREAIHKFLTLMAECGFKSCYDFGPIGKAGPPIEIGPQPLAEPALETELAQQNAQATTVKRRTRRDLLAPLVEKAQRECHSTPCDTPVVFALLRQWASSPAPHAPLVGVTVDGNIQWRDANDSPKELTLRALRERLRPMAKRQAKTD